MSAFPDSLHDEAIEHIGRFSVGIRGIDVREQREVPHQSGTGTLIGSQRLPPERGFDHVTGHWVMVGLASAPVETLRDGFDYLDVSGRPGVDPDMPNSFGGASGGGLWQGLIRKHPHDRLEFCDVIFSGVIFYQSDVVKGIRMLRSHGRASLHERLAEAIQKVSLS